MKKEIIVLFTTREEAEEFEKHLHEVYEVDKNPQYRNQKIGQTGFSRAGQKMSEETKSKISKAHLGKKVSEETKSKISKAMKGKPCNEKSREVARKTGRINGKKNLGRKRSDNTSGYAGIVHLKSKNKYYGRISFEGKTYVLGLCSTAAEASEYYQTALREIQKTGKLDIANIRELRYFINQCRKQSRSTGVFANKDCESWKASILFQGKPHKLGDFSTALEAYNAYRVAWVSIAKTGKVVSCPPNLTALLLDPS